MTKSANYPGDRASNLSLVTRNDGTLYVAVDEAEEGAAPGDRVTATVKLSRDEAARLAGDLADWLSVAP